MDTSSPEAETADASVSANHADAVIDPALACFVLLAKFLGLPADPSQIHHDRGKGDDPYTLEHLSRIGKKLGLIARLRDAKRDDLPKIPLPCIARTQDGGAFILLKIEEESLNPRYLIQRGDAERPEVLSADKFDEEFAGRLLLLTSREKIAGDKRPFDISWFIPALVKYRRALRDVLVGSFFLQLMGLASPIFFQLVIDKVLVHQSLTTLEVLAEIEGPVTRADMIMAQYQGGPEAVDPDVLKISLMTQDMNTFGATTASESSLGERERETTPTDYLAG